MAFTSTVANELRGCSKLRTPASRDVTSSVFITCTVDPNSKVIVPSLLATSVLLHYNKRMQEGGASSIGKEKTIFTIPVNSINNNNCYPLKRKTANSILLNLVHSKYMAETNVVEDYGGQSYYGNPYFILKKDTTTGRILPLFMSAVELDFSYLGRGEIPLLLKSMIMLDNRIFSYDDQVSKALARNAVPHFAEQPPSVWIEDGPSGEVLVDFAMQVEHEVVVTDLNKYLSTPSDSKGETESSTIWDRLQWLITKEKDLFMPIPF